MKIFSSLGSLDQIRGSPLGPMLREIVIRMLGHFQYDLADDGFVVLMEPGDVDRVLTDLCLPYRLHEMPFEAVHMMEGHFCGIFLRDNQFAITFLIPDAHWLTPDVRARLDDLMEK